jgi:hypothetical protein
MHWYRCWIDLDADGRCTGAGYELRDAYGERIEINVLPSSRLSWPVDGMRASLEDIGQRFGWSQDLFSP